jgi:hypothetical protein
LHGWKKEFIEKGPEIFSQQTTIQEYEKRIEDLERLISHKDVAELLIDNRADVNAKADKGRTPLHGAGMRPTRR